MTNKLHPANPHSKSSAWVPLLVFTLLACAIGATGYFVFNRHQEGVKEEAHDTLGAIADLRVNQVAEWREAYRKNAGVIASDPLLAMEIERWLQRGTPLDPGALQIVQRLKAVQQAYDFQGVFILDERGVVRDLPVTPDARPPTAYGVQLVMEAMRTRQAILTDLHPGAEPPRVRLDLVVPIFAHGDARNRAIAGIYFRIDPQRYLFPLLQSWPTPSPSAEAFLARREGDEIVYLNNLRHRDDTALKLRFPVSERKLLAAMMARGQGGLIEGNDYRGILSIAAAKKIPDSPWFLVAKMDKEELYAPIHRTAWIVAVLTFAFIIVAGVATGLWWRQQRAQFLARQYEEKLRHQALMQRSERQTRLLLDSAAEAIYGVNMEGLITFANPACLHMLGYAREDELLGRHGHELFHHSHPDGSRYPVEECRIYAAYLNNQVIHVDDEVFWRKDGSAFPVEYWSHPIRHAGQVEGAVITFMDIAERKHAERQLRLAAQVFEDSREAIFITDAQNHIVSVNQAFIDITGYPPDEVIGQSPSLLKSGRHDADFFRSMMNAIHSSDHWQGEIWNRRKNGEIYPAWMAISAIRDDRGQITHYAAIYSDISELKAAEENLRLWGRAMESSVNAIFIVDARQENFPVFYVNSAFERTTGYSSKEVVGKSCRLLDSGELNQPQIGNIYQAIREQHDGSAVLRNYRKDGGLFWFELFFSPVRDEAGCVTHFVGALNDITERKRAEESLKNMAMKFRTIYESSSDAIMLLDEKGFFDCNQTALRIFGCPTRDDFINKHPPQFSPPTQPGGEDSLSLANERISTAFKNGNNQFEWTHCRLDGTEFPAEVSLTAMELDGKPVLQATVRDITERKHYESQLERQANYDALTGLANRNLFQDRLSQALISARRNDRGLAVLFIDLDNFKHINDSLGHDAGDLLLTQVAARLVGNVREGDTVARQGGDEFVLILSEIREEDDVQVVAQKILKAMSAPFDIKGRELHITCSIGIASYPKDGEDSQTLLKNANAAMYRAKEMGRNNAQYYAAEMNVRAMERLVLENGLHHALERDEFLLHYQPQVDLQTGEITGMEALVRWQHPELGLVSPAMFIPVAEDSGLIVALGEWVLRTACAQNKAWQLAGLKPISIAVNLSARQFRQPDLVEMVAAILRETGLDPVCLELELTESLVMQDVEATIATLSRLKAMGLKLSVDDFGTGYSSLSYLKRFPIDTLKIDQSFVRDITTDPDDAAIAKAIISMAHDMQLRVIAEGVETEAQKSFLRLRRCDEMQGYFFSRPVPAVEFENLLREGSSLPLDDSVAGLGQRTLLLLDDEENILTSLTRLLRHDGYKILKATSAAAAFDLLAAHPVGVIVSDQRMPEMNGVEFLRRVKRLYPDTVRMVLSGYTDLKSVTDAINEGAVYKFLTKPWDDELLRANIQEAFQHHDLIQDNLRLGDDMASINEELNRAKRELEMHAEKRNS